MSVDNQDLFVQIDALLGKRNSEALVEQVSQVDDFPTLTEIIHVEHATVVSDVPATSVCIERRQSERRATPAVLTQEAIPQPDADILNSATLASLEQKINDLFALHKSELESVIRQIIRDEIRNINAS